MSASPYKQFNQAYMLSCAALGILFVLCSAMLPDVTQTGDLVRVSGHAPSGFKNPHAASFQVEPWATGSNDWDILVVGDSFCGGYGGACWQNDLSTASGLGVLSSSSGWNFYDVNKHLSLGHQREQHKTRIVILEFVERQTSFSQNDSNNPVAKKSRFHHVPLTGSRQAIPRPVIRVTRVKTFGMRQRLRALSKLIRYQLLGDAPVVLNQLSRSDLFSSKRANELLTSSEDDETPRWDEEQVRPVRQALAEIQNRIQDKYQACVLFIVAPNKLTAYTPYLSPPQLPRPLLEDLLKKDPLLNIIPIGKALQNAIANGTPDVYQPDDTHWGPNGHSIVARTVLKYLIAQNLYRQSAQPQKPPSFIERQRPEKTP